MHAIYAFLSAHLTLSLRSQSHISWFLLSLCLGGAEECSLCSLDRRTARSQARTHSGQVWTTWSERQLPSRLPLVFFFFFCIFFLSGLNVLSLEVVCTITSFDEAVRRGSGWKQSKSSGSSAKLTMRLDWTQAPRRQYTPRSRTYFFLSRRFPLQSPFQRLVCKIPQLIYWLVGTKLTRPPVWSPSSAMTSPAKFRKDKEIVAEYETQVKGNTFVYYNLETH